MPDPIRTPDNSQHIAIAGRQGSGKTWAAIAMLAQRDLDSFPFVIIDHKKEDGKGGGPEGVASINAEPFNPNSHFLPSRGLHIIHAKPDGSDREDIETFLQRAFERGKTGIFVDEGHLLGFSKAIRMILVAGRSKRVPLMWVSQRAHWIDPFIWSQSNFYRVFDLQGPHDIKRFNENFPMKWRKPDEHHSWYYDVSKGRVSYLRPSADLNTSKNVIDAKLRTQYRAI